MRHSNLDVIEMSPRKSSRKRNLETIRNETRRLNQLRLNIGITQEDLADEIGVSQSYIARIERGSVDPKLSTVLRIHEVFDRYSSKTCGDVMTENPITISARDSVSSAVRIMRRRGFSQLPVVRGGQVIGLITERDVIRNLELDFNEVTVGAIMSPTGVPTVDELTPVNSIIPLLDLYLAVMVLKQGRIQGIITRTDVIRKAK